MNRPPPRLTVRVRPDERRAPDMLNKDSFRDCAPRVLFRALCLSTVVSMPSAQAADEHQDNVGQSVAHPLSRFDLRFKYMDFAGDQAATVMEARFEHPFDLPRNWKLNTRVNLSGWVGDLRSRDNLDGRVEAGTGDLYTQLFFIAPPIGRTSIAFEIGRASCRERV